MVSEETCVLSRANAALSLHCGSVYQPTKSAPFTCETLGAAEAGTVAPLDTDTVVVVPESILSKVTLTCCKVTAAPAELAPL